MTLQALFQDEREGPPDAVTQSSVLVPSYPWRRLLEELSSEQASRKQPGVQFLSYMEIHLTDKQCFLFTISQMTHRETKSIAFVGLKLYGYQWPAFCLLCPQPLLTLIHHQNSYPNMCSEEARCYALCKENY